MRHFLRHPADIPIEIRVTESCASEIHAVNEEQLHDISHGGLAFNSHTDFKQGTVLSIRLSPASEIIQAVVVWCHHQYDHYDTGVKFLDKDDAFRARMVEQIHHIEQYRKQVLKQEGRTLTGREAAQEWIQRYASNFPQTEETRMSSDKKSGKSG